MPVEPLSYDQRSYPQVRGGLSGKNLSIRPDHGKRYIWAKSQGVDILKMAPSVPPPIPSSLMIRNFKVSEGRPLRSNCARD